MKLHRLFCIGTVLILSLLLSPGLGAIYRVPPRSSRYYTPDLSVDVLKYSCPGGNSMCKAFRIISGDGNYVISATSRGLGSTVIAKKIVTDMDLDPNMQLWNLVVTWSSIKLRLSSSPDNAPLFLACNTQNSSWYLSDSSNSELYFTQFNPASGRIAPGSEASKNLYMGLQYFPDNDDAILTTNQFIDFNMEWNIMYQFSFAMDPGDTSQKDSTFDNSAYYSEDLYVNPSIVSGTKFRLVTPDLRYVLTAFCPTLGADSADRSPITPVQIVPGRRPNPLEVFSFDGLTNYTLQAPSPFVYPPQSVWGVLSVTPAPQDLRAGLFYLTLQMASYVVPSISGAKPQSPAMGVPVKLVPLQEGYFALCTDASTQGKCYAYSEDTNIIYMSPLNNCDKTIRWLPLEANDVLC